MPGHSMYFKGSHLHTWQELANLALLPVTAIWVAAWFNLVTATDDLQGQTRVLVVFLLVFVLAYLSLRFLDEWRVPGAIRFLAGMVFFALSAWGVESYLIYQRAFFNLPQVFDGIWDSFTGLISLSKEFWSIFTVCLIWMWVILFVRRPVTQDRILNRVVLGLVMIMILLVISGQWNLIVLVVGLVLFMIFSLLSLSLARIADFNLVRGGKRLAYDSKLVVGLAGLSSVIVILAGGLSFVSSKSLISLVLALANGFMSMVRFLVEEVIQPVVNIIAYLLKELIGLFYKPGSDFEIPELELQPPQINGLPNPLEIEESTAATLREAQPYIVASILLLFVVAVIVLFVLRRNHERIQAVDGEENDQVGGNPWNQLTTTLIRRIQSVVVHSIEKINPQKAAGYVRAARIRWIYHQLENLGARKGCPRPVATTPAEYERVLVSSWPGCDQELHFLTRAYQSVRYGELPESDEDVLKTRKAWQTIQKNLSLRSMTGNSRKP